MTGFKYSLTSIFFCLILEAWNGWCKAFLKNYKSLILKKPVEESVFAGDQWLPAFSKIWSKLTIFVFHAMTFRDYFLVPWIFPFKNSSLVGTFSILSCREHRLTIVGVENPAWLGFHLETLLVTALPWSKVRSDKALIKSLTKWNERERGRQWSVGNEIENT